MNDLDFVLRMDLGKDNVAKQGETYSVWTGVSAHELSYLDAEPIQFGVSLHLDGLAEEVAGVWHKRLKHYPAINIESLVEFNITMLGKGKGRLSAEIYYQNKWLTSANLEYEVI